MRPLRGGLRRRGCGPFSSRTPWEGRSLLLHGGCRAQTGVGTAFEGGLPQAAFRNETERNKIMKTCEDPFQRGALCKLCSVSEPVGGMRFCSRVVAGSSAMRAVIERASAVARTDASVVLLGE